MRSQHVVHCMLPERESLSKSYMQTSTARNHSINFTAVQFVLKLKNEVSGLHSGLEKNIVIFSDDPPSSAQSSCGRGVHFVNNRVCSENVSGCWPFVVSIVIRLDVYRCVSMVTSYYTPGLFNTLIFQQTPLHLHPSDTSIVWDSLQRVSLKIDFFPKMKLYITFSKSQSMNNNSIASKDSFSMNFSFQYKCQKHSYAKSCEARSKRIRCHLQKSKNAKVVI